MISQSGFWDFFAAYFVVECITSVNIQNNIK